jgi:hypothetical protein
MNLIDDLINGNISDAKRKARNRSFMWIIQKGEEMGLSLHDRWNVATFLKGHQSFQEYCDHQTK